MTDKLNIPIQIGDIVAASMSSYVDVMVGTVVGFTPKMVKIRFHNSWDKTTRPDTLVVITQQHAYNLATYPEVYV